MEGPINTKTKEIKYDQTLDKIITKKLKKIMGSFFFTTSSITYMMQQLISIFLIHIMTIMKIN